MTKTKRNTIQTGDERILRSEVFTTTNISPKSRLVALLLAVFLGGFGAHRFYTGKVGTGIVMAALTCTLIGALITGPWALIDIIMIAAGAFRDKKGRPVVVWEANNA